jgi:hypothetical protein
MMQRSRGLVVIAAFFLFAGTAGIAAFVLAIILSLGQATTAERLFSLAWSLSYLATGVFVWRVSPTALTCFLASSAFPLIFFFIALWPSLGLARWPFLALLLLVLSLFYRYLHRSVGAHPA